MPQQRAPDNDIVATARKRLKQAQDHEAVRRAESRIDLEFLIGNQWEQKLRTDRANEGLPSITVNLCDAFVNQVCNELDDQNEEIKFVPAGQGAREMIAEVYEGVLRKMQHDSDGQGEISQATRYMVASGVGYLELVAECVDPESNEHELRIEAIPDPSMVYIDPLAMKRDRSDARWAIKVITMSRIEYLERYPDSAVAGADFFPHDKSVAEWMSPNGDRAFVMVADYWTLERGDSDAVAEGDEQHDGPMGNPKKDLVLRRRRINGVEILPDEDGEAIKEFPGQYIPLVPLLGNETWVDGKRDISSLLRNARGPNELYNWHATSEAEVLSLSKSAPWTATAKMIEGRKEWAEQNIRYKQVLIYNIDPQNPGAKPERNFQEPPIQAISQAKAQTQQEMRDVVGIQRPAMGAAEYSGQSGKAIGQLRSESDMATLHYAKNRARALKHLGRIAAQWIPYYYDTEKEIRILGPELKDEIVMVNSAIFQEGQDIPQEPYKHPITRIRHFPKIDVGRYDVVCDVGSSYATAREESQAFYSDLVKAAPQLLQVIGDLLIESSDAQGSSAAAARVKAWIEQTMPGVIQDGDQPQVPPQVQAQMSAMQQQVQQLTQVVQQLQQVIQTKQIESQGRIEVEKVKQQTALTKADMDTKAAMAQAALDHQAERGKQSTELVKAALQHKHDMFKATLESHMAAAQHMLEMLHESELAPGPEGGNLGIHPQAIPPPMPKGAPNGAA